MILFITHYPTQSNQQIYGFTQPDSMMLWMVILPHPNQCTLYGLGHDFG